jgi:hypothetical protein
MVQLQPHSMEVVINLIQVGRRLVVSTNVQYYSIPQPFTSLKAVVGKLTMNQINYMKSG